MFPRARLRHGLLDPSHALHPRRAERIHSRDESNPFRVLAGLDRLDSAGRQHRGLYRCRSFGLRWHDVHFGGVDRSVERYTTRSGLEDRLESG